MRGGHRSAVTANNMHRGESRTLMVVEQGRVGGLPTVERNIGELLALESAGR